MKTHTKFNHFFCNCHIGDVYGVNKTDGKIIKCSNYKQGDCIADKPLYSKIINILKLA